MTILEFTEREDIVRLRKNTDPQELMNNLLYFSGFMDQLMVLDKTPETTRILFQRIREQLDSCMNLINALNGQALLDRDYIEKNILQTESPELPETPQIERESDTEPPDISEVEPEN